MNSNTLNPQINLNPRYDRDKASINTCIQMIQDANPAKKVRDQKNDAINKLLDEGFEVSEPTGPRRIPSQMLHQATWRLCNKLKLLDFSLHGTGEKEHMEKIVTQGVSTVLRRSEFVSSFTGKGGVFQAMTNYGDGYFMLGPNPNKNALCPIKAMPVQNSNVYTDQYSTSMHIGGMGRTAEAACVIFSMSWGQAIRLFPKLKRVGAPGKIPRDMYNWKETQRDYYQTSRIKSHSEETEIAYFWHLPSKTYTIFAGPTCAILEEYEKDDYPFMLDGEPYINLFQFSCLPANQGFHNRGIGDLLYRLALANQYLLNLQLGYVTENTWPTTLYNIPNGEVSNFFAKLAQADLLRAQGQRAFVTMEYDAANPGAGRVDAQSLTTGNLTSQWQVIRDSLDREVRRNGIFLDDINNDPNALATQIIAQEQNSDNFAKQIMEWNTPEYEFMLNVALDMIKKFVPSKSKMPINMTSMVEVDDEETGEKVEVRMDNFTMGAVADRLKKYNYFPIVNARSGAIPSGILEINKLKNVLAVTPPGTPAYFKAVKELSALNDRDYKLEDFTGQGQGQPQQVNAEQPTETDELAITGAKSLQNPKSAF